MNPAFAGRAGADADVDVVLVPPPKQGGGGDGDARAGRETRGNDDDATEAAREAAREDEPDRSFGPRLAAESAFVLDTEALMARLAATGEEEMEEEEEEEDRREDRNPSSSSARATEDDSKSEDGEDDSAATLRNASRASRGFHSRRRVRLRPRFLRRWRSRFHRTRTRLFLIGGERCPFRAGRR